jgi:hypothetical protein
MSWDDWVFGALTGGAYNVGKGIAETAGAVGDVVEGAGSALAGITSTITKLGNDLSSFIKEMEELLTIKRSAPRDEDDLWDEEVERLKALRELEAELVTELENLGASDDDHSWFDSLFDVFFGLVSQEELATRTKLAVVRGAIQEILYQEPGVVSTTVHNLQLILERFNTLEQPRLEDILDSVDDNLEESEEILQEVKKLFVVKTFRPVIVAELSPLKRKELDALQVSVANFDGLIAKNSAVSTQLQQALLQAQPTTFQMSKMIGTSFEVSGGPGGGNPGGNPGDPPPTFGGSFSAGDRPGTERPVLGAVLASGPSFALKGKVSTIAAQPMSMSVATALNQNAVSAYLDNYAVVEARNRYFSREKLKLEKAIYRINWVAVEEPGVIPKMLEEIKQTIERFRTEAQPRIETMLDNVNGTVLESTAVLSNVNTSLKTIQGALDFVAKHSLIIKIGLAAAGVLMLLILLMSLIALFRVAFGF